MQEEKMRSAGLVLTPNTLSTILLIVAAFLVGSLWTQVRDLKQGIGTQVAQPAATAQTTAAQPAQATTVTIDQIKSLFDGKSITFGSKDSKLIFTEFSDPSCPYCHVAGGLDSAINTVMGAQFKLVSDGGTYVPPVAEMKKLVDANKAAFVWKYYPGHGNGEMGTRALYCAYASGKFWQVHDLLMSEKGYEILNGTDPSGAVTTGPIVKNDKTKSGDLANFLKSAMDPTQMKNCIDSGKYDSYLTTDTSLGQKFGVNGTPGFFVNTTNYAGAYSYKDMETVVASALK